MRKLLRQIAMWVMAILLFAFAVAVERDSKLASMATFLMASGTGAIALMDALIPDDAGRGKS